MDEIGVVGWPKMTHFGSFLAPFWASFWGPKMEGFGRWYDICRTNPAKTRSRGSRNGVQNWPHFETQKWSFLAPKSTIWPGYDIIRTGCGPVWHPRGPKMLQNGPKWSKNGQKMTKIDSKSSILIDFWPFLVDLGPSAPSALL